MGLPAQDCLGMVYGAIQEWYVYGLNSHVQCCTELDRGNGKEHESYYLWGRVPSTCVRRAVSPSKQDARQIR